MWPIRIIELVDHCSQRYANKLHTRQGVAGRNYYCQYYVAISRVVFQEAVKILIGSAKYQGIGMDISVITLCILTFCKTNLSLKTTKLSRVMDGNFVQYS